MPKYHGKPARQVRDLTRPMAKCRWHVEKHSGYISWMNFAEDKTRAGHQQKKCPDCGRFFFKEEWGTAPRGRAWRTTR
jgi:hypothetical protein